MSIAMITALATGIPAILAAITALIQALKAKNTATMAQGMAQSVNTGLIDHVVKTHDMFPIQPPMETKQ